MTRKLYYEDSYCERFEAVVISCCASNKGYSIVLDQTAFYPGGGGQPEDRGELGGQDLIDIYEEDDVIYHIVQEAVEVGSKLVGEVYIEKRLDYMAQHTGEHIVSGIIHKWFGYNNVGFHLSDTYMTADYDGELTKEQLDLVELKSNEAVFANVPVIGKFYETSSQLPAYRAKLAFEGQVRLVTIGDYDTCACCGTQVATTGEIGVIKIVGYEKHRGGCRLTILCGRRAIYDYQARYDAMSELSGMLSARPNKIVEAVAKQSELLKSSSYQLSAQKRAFYMLEVQKYHKDRPLCLIHNELPVEDLKLYAECLAQRDVSVALILVPVTEGFKYIVQSQAKDVRPFAKALNEISQGKGGGKANLCQGSAKGDVEAAKQLFETYFPSWVTELENYVPWNEQEATEKEIFLQYVAHFGNTLLRENAVAHLSSSGWIVNKSRTKVLMIYHNIYKSWSWTGGHTDGRSDLIQIAIEEAMEETGIEAVTPIKTDIFSLDILPVPAHYKRGKYVAPHLHLSVAYLLEADDTLELMHKPDENSGVKWVAIEELMAHTESEPDMQVIYQKFMNKLQ